MHRYYFVALRIPDDFSEDGDSEQNGNINEESEHIQVSASQESNVLPMLRLHLTRQARPNACMPKMISLQGQMHQPEKQKRKAVKQKHKPSPPY